MSIIIDGKLTSAKVRSQLREQVANMQTKPGLAVIMVGDNPASEIYVRNKIKACEEVGIYSLSCKFDATVSQAEIEKCIMDLNANDAIHGILMQLPLPKGFDEAYLLELIDPKKDVDGFSAESVGRLVLGKDGFRSCTPFGVIKLLEEYNIDIAGKSAVIVGRSNIVGKPLAFMLLEKNATVTICHTKTANLKEVCASADILVSATGKALSITADMVKEGAVVIDVGISKLDGKTVGDVCYDEVSKKASYITPVPGGVGPMTITMLMVNTVKAAQIYGN